MIIPYFLPSSTKSRDAICDLMRHGAASNHSSLHQDVSLPFNDSLRQVASHDEEASRDYYVNATILDDEAGKKDGQLWSDILVRL